MIKLAIVIRERYHCYHLHAKCHPVFLCWG